MKDRAYVLRDVFVLCWRKPKTGRRQISLPDLQTAPGNGFPGFGESKNSAVSSRPQQPFQYFAARKTCNTDEEHGVTACAIIRAKRHFQNTVPLRLATMDPKILPRRLLGALDLRALQRSIQVGGSSGRSLKFAACFAWRRAGPQQIKSVGNPAVG